MSFFNTIRKCQSHHIFDIVFQGICCGHKKLILHYFQIKINCLFCILFKSLIKLKSLLRYKYNAQQCQLNWYKHSILIFQFWIYHLTKRLKNEVSSNILFILLSLSSSSKKINQMKKKRKIIPEYYTWIVHL